jgi:hypothetical protein
VRAQLAKPVVIGALTGFAFLAASMSGEALATSSVTQPIVNAACSSVPKNSVLIASDTDQMVAGHSRAASSSSSPSASASSSSDPSKSTSASPSPSTSGSASTSTSPTPTPTPSSSKKSTSSPSPSPSPTKTAKPTPTPSSSPSPKPKKKTVAQLCVRVQSFSSSSEVKAGHTATFAVWVWSSKAASNGVTVTLSVASAEDLGVPSFSVCPVADGKTCKLGDMPSGQADELEAGVPVHAKAALGEQVQLTATAAAKGAKSFNASATDVVVVSPPPSTTTPQPSAPTLPPTSIPPISGTGSSPGNASNLFPTVTPTPSSGPSSLGLPSVKPKRTDVGVTDAADTVPLDPRLIGGQLAGLAVLAGGIAIAIARLSLRSPKPQDDKSGPQK